MSISGARPGPSGGDVRELAQTTLPTEAGTVTLRIYGAELGGVAQWVVCSSGAVAGKSGVHLRVHDACLTSEVLGSLKCDCAHQLRQYQDHLCKHGGILIYTPQEGRGIGLANKIRAYDLQEREGLDTVDANTALGLPAEARDYTPVRRILDDLGVRSVTLFSNNPFKLDSLRALGVAVVRSSNLEPASLASHPPRPIQTAAS